ncbi:MAG: rod shape-determining protein RodA [Candidatus Moranbacteria bacterium CG_4_10_14_3_um_filter_41_65]|nr:MAG: rod shape-determining protein RodA [Candidatus Moranbacteria bacterium CG23_combo_of_CG06-09_8_20_14_all_41_28]PIV85977.1 MAG: rod shape-determining protein RodA [Candidatus Moranbacteria bacterium CG17_big_fil_post_rev_8_21_14_2_50_41_107]PIW94402.1 MAG: rod shape-determining protein RodA [Candidatus Moranbacteria bacterium CG_4_8_14_3_um_filter_41_13]PIX91668.1 MAG: rod shape-determining protein RodA [Candidatus Moranbacteria bacterium CG_4_10_14_3_um_filter_41_65]PJC00147.1 MAG: rod 
MFSFVLQIFFKLDFVLLSAVFLLLGVSLLTLYSISSVSGVDYFLKQSIFIVFGIAVMMFITFLDYRHIRKYSTLLYFSMLFVLLAVLFFGRTVNGTAGWVSFGLFQVQPVEFSKVVLIIFLASFISKKKSELGEWARVIVSFVLSITLIFLVLKQPDLGSSLVLGAIWVSMILSSGLRMKHLIVLTILGLTLTLGSWFVLADYQKDRINTFLHPELDPRGSGYNVLQAIVAVGSGGITGKGVGHGSQSQLNFLPEKHTDFIFAVISEELGLIGAFFVVSVYGIILYRIKRIGEMASDNFGYLVSVGIFTMLFVQIIINVGMNIGLMPVTGIPAPFLSYGGSSLVATFFSVGLLLNIYQKKHSDYDLHISLERGSLD